MNFNPDTPLAGMPGNSTSLSHSGPENAVFRQYKDLLEKLKEKMNEANTHMISLSALRKWVQTNIDIQALNALDDSFAGIRNQLAVLLTDLARRLSERDPAKEDAAIYANMAAEIADVDPMLKQVVEDARRQIGAAKAAASDTGIGKQLGAYAIFAVICFVIYLVISNRNTKLENQANVRSPAENASFTFSTVDSANGAVTQDVIGIKGKHANLRVINQTEKLAKIVIQATDNAKLHRSMFIDVNEENALTDIKSGIYTFKIAAGDRDALMDYHGQPSYMAGGSPWAPSDSLIFVEDELSYTQVTITLKYSADGKRGFEVFEEQFPKK